MRSFAHMLTHLQGDQLPDWIAAAIAITELPGLRRFAQHLERVHAAAAAPPEEGRIAAVSRASLRADLTNALERNRRLTVRVRQLEKRLSESLGETAWKESGLGASADIDQL